MPAEATPAGPRDVTRYAPEPCVRDVMDVCAALHMHHAVVIGTSFGGLLAMGLAAARPSLIRAVMLNDIGPDIGSEGADFVRDFVGNDPALESLEACVAFLRANLPPMSLDTRRCLAPHGGTDLPARAGWALPPGLGHRASRSC